jgi:hypothetical protein
MVVAAPLLLRLLPPAQAAPGSIYFDLHLLDEVRKVKNVEKEVSPSHPQRSLQRRILQ